MPELALFHFLRPAWLLALAPLALLAWHLARGGGNDDNPWRRAVDAALLPLLSVGRAGAARRASIGLVAAGWAIAVLALAGPTWQRKPQPVFQTSAARVVVLDLSNSMLATDVAPSRLERARFKVEDVLALGGEGQTGLVAYAGDAFAVAPLTRDANTVRSLLAVLAPDLMPVPGSRADRGLLEAQKLMRQAGVSRGEVLLIADGVDPAHADDAKRAAAQLLANGYRVSVLGVGARAAGGASAGGAPALDAATLQAIASAGGGRYLSLADSGDALRTLLDTGAQARVDAARSEAGATASVWVDQGPWLVLLLLPIAALAFRRNRLFEAGAAQPRKTPARAASAGGASALVAGTLALAAGLAPPTPARASAWDDAWQRPDQQAAAAMRAGDYARAVSLATDAELRGSAEYKRGNYAAALADFARASGPRADYNRGNALAQLGRYADAVAAYDKSLAAEPGNADAKANKAAVEALLKEQQEKRSKDQPRDGEPQSSAKHNGQQQGGGQQDGQPQRAPQQSGQQQGAQLNDSRQPTGEQQGGRQQGGQQQGSQQQGGQQQGSEQQGGRQQGGKQQGGQQQGGQQQGGQQQGSEQQAERPQASAAQRNGSPSQRGQSAQQPSQQPQASAAAGAASPAAPGAESTARERTAGAPQQQPAQSFTDAAKRIAESNDTRGDAGDAPPNGAPAAAAQRGPAAGGHPAAANTASGEAQPIPSEEQLAAEQWLRRIPDDPGGLLRRKFLYQYRQRSGAGGG